MKPYLLRLHRWISLTFALPLVIVIVTGLFLSLQPILQTASVVPGSVTLEKAESLLARHDPQGAARSLRIDTFQNAMSLDRTRIDLATGEAAAPEGWLSRIVAASRGVHERLVFDLEWLVVASTAAMLAIIALGMLMGLPRLANTVSGWHKATAWFLLPLLVLSPLTGLFLAAGLTFSEPAPRAPPVPLAQALRLVAAEHDLSGLEWIRSRGGRQMARLSGPGGQATYIVTRDGLKPAPANWPRTFHEGVFWGVWGGVMNLVLSVAFMLLLGTGLTIWARRAFRRRRRPARRAAPAS